jgi:hypothetical protein
VDKQSKKLKKSNAHVISSTSLTHLYVTGLFLLMGLAMSIGVQQNNLKERPANLDLAYTLLMALNLALVLAVIYNSTPLQNYGVFGRRGRNDDEDNDAHQDEEKRFRRK